MNATPTTFHRPGTRLRWPVRLTSLLLSVLLGASLLVAAGGPASAEPTGGYERVYVLTNSLTGQVIDNANQSTTAGNPIIQWPRNGGANQEWLLIRATGGGGLYQLRNRHSGLCLVGHPDHTVTQEPCSGPFNIANRYWKPEELGDGTYRLRFGPNSTYLAAPATPASGGGLTLVDWGLRDIQWTIEEIRLPYSFETDPVRVPGWQVRTIGGECREGWKVETASDSSKPRYDYIGDSDLNVHTTTAKVETGSSSSGYGALVDTSKVADLRRMEVDVGNPLWHAMEAKIRIYCVHA